MHRYTVNLVVLEADQRSTLEAPTDGRARQLTREILTAAMADRPGVNAYAALGVGEGEDVHWLGCWDLDGETGATTWSDDD